jgi:hypothetical protein
MYGRNSSNTDTNAKSVNRGRCGKRHQNAMNFDGGGRCRRGGCRRDSSNENALLSEQNWLEQRLNEVKERLDAFKSNITKAEENKA